MRRGHVGLVIVATHRGQAPVPGEAGPDADGGHGGRGEVGAEIPGPGDLSEARPAGRHPDQARDDVTGGAEGHQDLEAGQHEAELTSHLVFTALTLKLD